MELSPRDRARAAPRLPPARWEGRIQHGGGEPAGVLGQQPNPRGCPGRSSGEPHNIKEERKTKRAKGEALPPPVTPQMTRTPAQRKRRVPPASPSTQAGLPAPPNQLGPPIPTRLQLAPPVPAPSSRLRCTRGQRGCGLSSRTNIHRDRRRKANGASRPFPAHELGPARGKRLLQPQKGLEAGAWLSPQSFGHVPGGKRCRGEGEGPGLAGSSQGDERKEGGPEDIAV